MVDGWPDCSHTCCFVYCGDVSVLGVKIGKKGNNIALRHFYSFYECQVNLRTKDE